MEPGTVLGGRFRLDRLIGTGGMGEVWQGALLGPMDFVHPIAVKLMLPELSDDDAFTALFLDEARLTARLVHPGLVRVFELGREPPSWFMVMEYVDGVDLGDLLDRLRQRAHVLPVAHALHVVRSLLRALDYAHGACDDDGAGLGIVHRDVSPGNVLCSYRTGEIKLTDFGVARARMQRHITDKGVRRGKLGYMAPEQSRCEAVDARTDVFAVGRILHQLLTGEHPEQSAGTLPGSLRGRTPRSRQSGAMPALPRPPDGALAAVAQRAMAPDPGARWPTARAMLEALAPFAHLPTDDDDFARLLEDITPRQGRRRRSTAAGSPEPALPARTAPGRPAAVRPATRLPALERPRGK